MNKPVSMPLMGGYFLLMYVILLMLLFGVAYAAMAFFNYEIESPALGYLVPVLAAMQCGDFYVRKTGERPRAGYMWTAALLFAVLTYALSALLFVVAARTQMGPTWAEVTSGLQPGDGPVLIGVLAVVFVVTWLLQRAAMWAGARSAAKRAEYQAARKASKGQ